MTVRWIKHFRDHYQIREWNLYQPKIRFSFTTSPRGVRCIDLPYMQATALEGGILAFAHGSPSDYLEFRITRPGAGFILRHNYRQYDSPDSMKDLVARVVHHLDQEKMR